MDWQSVEHLIGCALPADYKETVRRYGPGCFSQFIHIYQPSSDLQAIDLPTQIGESLWALRYLRDAGEPIPYRLDEPAEVLAFGRTDNGDILFWRRAEIDAPEKWTVLVKEPRGEEWFEFPGDMSGFLAGVLDRRISVPIFPRRFPSVAPIFEPY
ncbi:SMI1/KNR4 family protein [Streptomyces sp. NPDC001634]|uniref:SMI1/KNR4 family protein n=1 Tax=Streptomyces sp. NPDC001634 TaxID=3154390 RepID=UPI00331FCF91